MHELSFSVRLDIFVIYKFVKNGFTSAWLLVWSIKIDKNNLLDTIYEKKIFHKIFHETLIW